MVLHTQDGPSRHLHRRPYWHVDAKWLVGLLLFLVWGATLLGFGLYRATDEKVAVPFLTTLLATSLSREGLDDAADVKEFRQRLQRAPNQRLRPIPQFEVYVRYDEVAGLTPRETRLAIFQKLAKPFYREGPDGIVRLSRSVKAVQSERLRKDTVLVSPLTRDFHDRLQKPLLIAGAAALALFALLSYFSAGLGRITSPGLVLLLAGLPGALAFAANAQGGQSTSLAQGETAGVGYAAQQLVPIALPPLTLAHVASLGSGAALLAVAAAARLLRG